MNDLIRSEWRRLRKLALGAGVAHALALLLMSRAMDVTQMPYGDQAAMLVVYMLLGLVLSLVQVGSYRQVSRWLWLIHRPLAPSRIFAALALSALALLGVAIFAPLLVFLVATHAITSQVVDVRHYVTLIHVMAFAMMAWLAGAHACTSRSKIAVAVLLAPLMLSLHLASVWWLLLPVTACLAWLLFVARHSFRANWNAPIARHGVLLLTALPLQLAFFLLVFQGSKMGIALVDLVGRGPGRTVLATDKDVDVGAAMRSVATDIISEGLKASQDPRAAGWRDQLPLLKLAGVESDVTRFPVRNQLGNLAQPWWDEKRNIKWTFSHDRMQFRGRDPRTGASHGWWGTEGMGSKARFHEVPAIGISRSMLYTVDAEQQRQHQMIQLPQGEWFVGRPVRALDHVMIETNRRLLAYRPDREAISAFAPPTLDWQLSLASGMPAPVEVIVVELLDGWLVSLFYSEVREFDGFESLTDPWQQVVFIGSDGKPTVVAERHEIHDYHVSAAGTSNVPVASWWVSPSLYALAHVPDLLDTGLTQPPRFDPLPRAPLFRILALVLMLASFGGAWAWLRGTTISASRRRLWLASCALLGVPAFLSMLCLEPRVRGR